jgi:HlyD family secretion protein
MRAKLDTTIQLRALRDDLINLKFAVEEARITLEQSKFEPPATIRQAEISLEKAERAFEQAEKNYDLRVREARANVRESAWSVTNDVSLICWRPWRVLMLPLRHPEW